LAIYRDGVASSAGSDLAAHSWLGKIIAADGQIARNGRTTSICGHTAVGNVKRESDKHFTIAKFDESAIFRE
jgi:hypothetical protein